MKKVYFAGKVKKDGFRQQLMGDCIMSKGNGTIVTINGGDLIYGGCDALDNKEKQNYNEYGRNESHLLTVPDEDTQTWVFKDDDYINMEHRRHFESALSPQDVVKRCFRQIDNCDAVYAYIDSPDCYGTLVELGYANAKGKPIYLVFSGMFNNEFLNEDFEGEECVGHNAMTGFMSSFLVGNTYVPKFFSMIDPFEWELQNIYICQHHIYDFICGNEMSFNSRIFPNRFLNQEEVTGKIISDLFQKIYPKSKKYSLGHILENVEHTLNCKEHHGDTLNMGFSQNDIGGMLGFIFYLLFESGEVDYICDDPKDPYYRLFFNRLSENKYDVYKDFWFVRNLDTLKKIDFHYPNTAIPFPDELLYFEPKYSVKDILTKLNRTTVNEDNLRELGLIISTEYQERTGQKPHKVNAENKGVSVPVNKYTEKDIGWIAEILKKQTKPNYKKYLGSLLAELNHLLDLAEKEKNIENIVSVLQKTLLEYQDIAIN